MPVDGWVLIAALAVTVFASTVQGVIGIGFAVVSVPVLSLLDPVLAPVPQLIITLPLTLSMGWRERKHVDLKGVGWILAGRVPGAVIGVALISVASEQALDIVIALFVLAAVAILASGMTLPVNAATQFGAGTLSGVSSLAASIGGPPLALLYRTRSGPTIRASLAAVFSVGIVITIVARLLAGAITFTDVEVAAWLFPGLVAGYLVSGRLRTRFEGPPIRWGILAISTLAATALLLRGLL